MKFKVGDRVRIKHLRPHLGVVTREKQRSKYDKYDKTLYVGVDFKRGDPYEGWLPGALELVKREPEYEDWNIHINETDPITGTQYASAYRQLKKNTVHRRMWLPGGEMIRVSVDQVGGEYQWDTLKVKKVAS